jgi:hypothetical protein
MAKFCTKCGSELVDSKCPKCADTKTVKSTKNEVVETTTVDVKQSFMDCLNVFKNIFTKPFEAIKDFVMENKYISGIIMIVVAALSTGLYKIATLKNAYSSNDINSFSANDLSSLFSSALSGNLTSSEPEYLKEFLTTFVTNLAEYALIAVIGYLIISKLFKGTASIKQIITAVGISLSVILAANLINSILVFIDGEFVAYLRTYVFSFGTILSTLILYVSVKDIAGIDKNKLFITVASMSVLATAAMDLFQKLFNS